MKKCATTLVLCIVAFVAGFKVSDLSRLPRASAYDIAPAEPKTPATVSAPATPPGSAVARAGHGTTNNRISEHTSLSRDLDPKVIQELRLRFTQEVLIDYADFFSRRSLDRNRKILLCEILVDRKLAYFEAGKAIGGRNATSSTTEEYAEFQKRNSQLLQDVLGEDGFQELREEEDRIAKERRLDTRLSEITKNGDLFSKEARVAFRDLGGIDLKNAVYGDVLVAQKPLDAEYETRIQERFDEEYREVRARLLPVLNEKELAALDAWHRRDSAKRIRELKRMIPSTRLDTQ